MMITRRSSSEVRSKQMRSSTKSEKVIEMLDKSEVVVTTFVSPFSKAHDSTNESFSYCLAFVHLYRSFTCTSNYKLSARRKPVSSGSIAGDPSIYAEVLDCTDSSRDVRIYTRTFGCAEGT